LTSKAAKPSPDKKSNAFFIPPKFAFSLKLNNLAYPRLAFYLRAFCDNFPKLLFKVNLFLISYKVTICNEMASFECKELVKRKRN
jgi:hypothetical protein